MANILPVSGQENPLGTACGVPTVEVCFSVFMRIQESEIYFGADSDLMAT